jgi:c-di-GMP-binding flagellar brake protein YcgR
MSSHKPLRLTFEILSDEELDRFSIHSKREIQFILKSIAKHGDQVALYYGSRENFILTTLIDVDSGGLWLEVSQNAKDNAHILQSRKFYFVSAHQHIKVQFTAAEIESDEYDGEKTFYIPLPHSVLRIQRREHFRQSTPIANPWICHIPLDSESPGKTNEFPILDISSGGVALSCAEDDVSLETGKNYPDCTIRLPDDLTINVTLQVRSIFPIAKARGGIIKRVGCKFVDLDGKIEMLLQRYITQLQMAAIKST